MNNPSKAKNYIRISILIFMMFSWLITNTFGQNQIKIKPLINTYMKTWKIDRRFAIVDTIPVDTNYVNYQEVNPVDANSISNLYNGNLGSPILSKLYFSRPASTDFIFSTPYVPYLMDVEHTTFYNTRTTYSNINYITGGTHARAQDDIRFLFTANANKKFNMGFTLDYLNSVGEYLNQASNRFSGSLFGSYNGKHYAAMGVLSTNSMKNKENGGMERASDLNAGYETYIIPVNLSTAQSNYKQTEFYYNHQYSIGIEREVKVTKDSTRMDFVPVTRFAHTIAYDGYRKRYYENSVEKRFYRRTYGTAAYTKDTAALHSLTNNFSVSMAEEFNKWMKFGMKVFLENEVDQFVFVKDSILRRKLNSNTKIGGILSKERGDKFKYFAQGELCLVGPKVGDFNIHGQLGGFFKLWNDSIALIANGFVRSDQPSSFLDFYESNHFRWSNDFGKVYRTHIGGTFSVPTRLFSLNVQLENITRNIYFDSIARPVQYSGNVQIIEANLRQDFHVGSFTLENNVVYQLSSNQNVMPLPTVTLFHNLYYHDLWFHVLSVQFGFDFRYNTSYKAPSYMPAIGQFYNQSLVKVGNFPLMNAYLNFHLKRVRFYVQYYHINNLFQKGEYFAMPYYPLSPAILKLGISWNFYN